MEEQLPGEIVVVADPQSVWRGSIGLPRQTSGPRIPVEIIGKGRVTFERDQLSFYRRI